MVSNNLFAYCDNNPVMGVDRTGKARYIKFELYPYKKYVWVTASIFLSAKGYDISEMLLKEALYGDGKLDLYQINRLVQKIKKYKKFNDKLINKVCSLGNNIASFGSEYNFEFNDGDLFYAIHGSKCFIKGKKKDNIWIVKVEVSDTFDFTENWKYKDHGIFASATNNLGYYMQIDGSLKPYKWKVKYTVRIDPKKKVIL